jgi:hypothetical protein
VHSNAAVDHQLRQTFLAHTVIGRPQSSSPPSLIGCIRPHAANREHMHEEGPVQHSHSTATRMQCPHPPSHVNAVEVPCPAVLKHASFQGAQAQDDSRPRLSRLASHQRPQRGLDPARPQAHTACTISNTTISMHSYACQEAHNHGYMKCKIVTSVASTVQSA